MKFVKHIKQDDIIKYDRNSTYHFAMHLTFIMDIMFYYEILATLCKQIYTDNDHCIHTWKLLTVIALY